MSVPPPRRSRVLLVEDDPSLLAALSFAFEAEGLAVRACASAADALSDPGEPDCLVVDLVLPDLNGLALIDRLREAQVAAPAILITTHPSARRRAQAQRMGVEIVEKPLLGGELNGRIAAAVAAARP